MLLTVAWASFIPRQKISTSPDALLPALPQPRQQTKHFLSSCNSQPSSSPLPLAPLLRSLPRPRGSASHSCRKSRELAQLPSGGTADKCTLEEPCNRIRINYGQKENGHYIWFNFDTSNIPDGIQVGVEKSCSDY
ncbi:hypothetical protein PM082_024417 [Marasmius tenuissimus]|nr:hypothetical protein PM082_024417 [Marasmius tenuissimus]